MLKPVDSSTAAPTAFGISSRRLDERTSAISVQGELDLSTAPHLKWTLLDALQEGSSRIVVDLSDVKFMDSTALGVLVAVNRNAALERPLAIVCPAGTVRQIFEVSGTERGFSMCSTFDEAQAQAVPGD